MPIAVYEDGNCLYSDETYVHINGHMKTQHCCVWIEEQSHEIYEHLWDSARGNAWCHIMRDHVVGSILCCKYYHGKHLHGYVKIFVFPHYLCHWPRGTRWEFVSTRRHSSQLQPWAPKCLERQIYSVDWKRRTNSEALTKSRLLNNGFFFCADMYKSIFYSQKIHIYVLCERIGPLIVAATLEILQRSWQEPKYLAHVCKGKVIPLQARCGPEGG